MPNTTVPAAGEAMPENTRPRSRLADALPSFKYEVRGSANQPGHHEDKSTSGVQITEDQVALSHDVASLLSVCTYVAERIAEDDDNDMVDDLARCLVCAYSWAKQVHEDLSMQHRFNQRARA